MSNGGWIGVDLDGTLARYDGWDGGSVGEPIPLMLERVKTWLSQGVEIRIMTARVGCTGKDSGEGIDDEVFSNSQRQIIQDWTEKHLGVRLPVTSSKDFAMIELWDDRAVGVHCNTGEIRTHERTREGWKSNGA